jgi:hypothetical protein
MKTGWPISHAFRYRHREFLGIYMGLRDKIPSARMQATMALRVHAREGDMKWVSLLIWAGADPRLEVPDLDSDPPERNLGTALGDALRHGREEVIRKIGVDPTRDDPTALLVEYAFSCKPRIVKMLIEAGADPSNSHGELAVMESLMTAFTWAIDARWTHCTPCSELECIEIVGHAGGRWRPSCDRRFRRLRTMLGRAKPNTVIRWLSRIVDSGAIERDVFTELVRTPKMREILATSAPGAVRLREFAGVLSKPTKAISRRLVSR